MQINIERVVSSAIFIISYIILLSSLNRSLYSVKCFKKWLGFSFFMIGTSVILEKIGIAEWLLYVFNIFISIVLYVKFFSQPIYKSISSSLFVTNILLINIIISKVITIMMMTDLEKGLNKEYIVYLLGTMLSIVVASYFRKNRIEIPDNRSFINTAFFLCLFILILFILKYSEPNNYLLFEENAFSIFVVSIIIQTGIISNTKFSSDAVIADKRLIRSEELTKNTEQLFEEIKLSQHEVSNQLQTMRILLEANDLTSDKDSYIDDISKNILLQQIVKLESRLLMGFLYKKLKEAKGKAILFQITVNKPDKIKKLTEYEVLEIVSCLLDNAFEASISDNHKHKEVIFKLYSRNGKDIIEVWNSFKRLELNEIDRFFVKGFSTKKDVVGSGYGLINLKTILEKTDADIFIENTELRGRNFIKFSIYI